MTLKAIADKYDIPYTIVVKAAEHIHPVCTRERTMDYPEKEVRKVLFQHLQKKRNGYKVKADGFEKKRDEYQAKSDSFEKMIRSMIERG